jgi:hypothetical protein
MTADTMSSRAGAGQPRHAQPRNVMIERRLRRYSSSAQERVRAVAQRHRRLADLALSFRPLLFALALPRLGHDPEPAIACVIEGRPLGEAAATAGIPLWLRKLPVDGLTQSLPALPAGKLFGRRIVNHLPRSPKRTTAWLAAVSDAAYWVNEPFAIWVARELATDGKTGNKAAGKTVQTDRLRRIGLWAWFSQHPDTDGHRLMETPWRVEMGFNAAHDAARTWLERVTLELSLGGRQVADPWLQPGPFDGHDFVPLDSAERIDQEASAMANCIRDYGYDVARDACRLWSIRRDGQRIANLDIRRYRGQPLLHVSELKAGRNEPASIELWWLVARWLHRHDLATILPEPRKHRDTKPDAAAWRKLWRPYWRATRRIPMWLPLSPSWDAIWSL